MSQKELMQQAFSETFARIAREQEAKVDAPLRIAAALERIAGALEKILEVCPMVDGNGRLCVSIAMDGYVPPIPPIPAAGEG